MFYAGTKGGRVLRRLTSTLLILSLLGVGITALGETSAQGSAAPDKDVPASEALADLAAKIRDGTNVVSDAYKHPEWAVMAGAGGLFAWSIYETVRLVVGFPLGTVPTIIKYKLIWARLNRQMLKIDADIQDLRKLDDTDVLKIEEATKRLKAHLLKIPKPLRDEKLDIEKATFKEMVNFVNDHAEQIIAAVDNKPSIIQLPTQHLTRYTLDSSPWFQEWRWLAEDYYQRIEGYTEKVNEVAASMQKMVLRMYDISRGHLNRPTGGKWNQFVSAVRARPFAIPELAPGISSRWIPQGTRFAVAGALGKLNVKSGSGNRFSIQLAETDRDSVSSMLNTSCGPLLSAFKTAGENLSNTIKARVIYLPTGVGIAMLGAYHINNLAQEMWKQNNHGTDPLQAFQEGKRHEQALAVKEVIKETSPAEIAKNLRVFRGNSTAMQEVYGHIREAVLTNMESIKTEAETRLSDEWTPLGLKYRFNRLETEKDLFNETLDLALGDAAGAHLESDPNRILQLLLFTGSGDDEKKKNAILARTLTNMVRYLPDQKLGRVLSGERIILDETTVLRFLRIAVDKLKTVRNPSIASPGKDSVRVSLEQTPLKEVSTR